MSHFRASFPCSKDFAPLFRLLDDYDTHRSTRSQPSARSFSPRFDTLVIKGHSEREYSTSNHQAQASERSVGEFQRTFSFLARVDQDNVKASLKHGILSVQVPKATAAATKKITIE
ncbi:hypothetical protein N7467_006915 [Penicillium canescens]|nr:hypothetical protein N7467_006915 [Penicillium canescens]